DERVREHLVTDEISIGDYVLSGGELAAMVVVDAVVRLLPGVLGSPDSPLEDSHSNGLLEYPQYTRPAVYRDWSVPQVLLSGNHAQIAKWRREQVIQRTLQRRPELLDRANLSLEEKQLVSRLKQS
ncbi:MAG TPA: tRNA (guanosine(37)-N1)-methyltransferase TrmD, partial [Dehalococcoidales bacterium]|nr:tRNA (guanosine(37)-N1)-methyltransferase TrmD [Dehalococcoidales bacterium]